MAFTFGSVELAKATQLGNKLVNYSLQFGGLTQGRDKDLMEKLARKAKFSVTGFTTGAGFPLFGTNNTTGLTQTTYAGLTTTLGSNVGFTMGVVYKTANPVTGVNLTAGTTAATMFGITGAIYFNGSTAVIS